MWHWHLHIIHIAHHRRSTSFKQTIRASAQRQTTLSKTDPACTQQTTTTTDPEKRLFTRCGMSARGKTPIRQMRTFIHLTHPVHSPWGRQIKQVSYCILIWLKWCFLLFLLKTKIQSNCGFCVKKQTNGYHNILQAKLCECLFCFLVIVHHFCQPTICRDFLIKTILYIYLFPGVSPDFFSCQQWFGVQLIPQLIRSGQFTAIPLTPHLSAHHAHHTHTKTYIYIDVYVLTINCQF